LRASAYTTLHSYKQPHTRTYKNWYNADDDDNNNEMLK